MVAFSTVKAGDLLWQKVRQRAGNTTMRRDAIYSIRVLEVHERHAVVSWNGNKPERWSEHQFVSLRRKRPEAEPTIWDRARERRQAAITAALGETEPEGRG